MRFDFFILNEQKAMQKIESEHDQEIQEIWTNNKAKIY